MAESLTRATWTSESFDDFLSNRDGQPEWLEAARREAWDAFGSMNWPSRTDEEWIRTDIRLFKLENYPAPGGTGEYAQQALPISVLDKGVDLAGRAVSYDGHTIACELDESLRERGVLFGDLETLSAEHSDLVKQYLNMAFDYRYDRFAALHGAFWTAGRLLYVPRGVVIDRPIHAFSALSDGGTDMGRTLVVLEEGAQATMLVENGSSQANAGGFHCGASELILAPSASLRYVSLQDWGNRTWHFAHQHAMVDTDASIQWTIGALGSRLAKVNQHVSLIGQGAHSQVNGTMFTEDKQHVSYHTLQHHRAPHTRSDFLYKAALQDSSRTVWRGMIKVDPAAQKTDGYQRNDNLLLSSQARSDSIPGLEIEADDVRCTHGSTTGRVNDEMLFYAMSRGFTRREAVRLIVTGFFQQIFDRITIDSVREALGQAIARRVREYD